MTAKTRNIKPGYIPFLSEHTIIVDPGKHDVKVFDVRDGKIIYSFSFPSITQLVPNYNGFETMSELQFQFEHEDEKYLVGEVVNGLHSYDTTKVNRHHQVCIYSAVARLIEDGEIINLVIGFPSSDFKNDRTLEQYKSLIRGTEGEEIETYLNGNRRSFTIRDIEVLPEGTALYTRKTNGNHAYHVIDVGGKNVNYRFYDARGNSSNAYSLDKSGMNYLVDALREALRGAVNGDEISIDAIDFNRVIDTKEIPNVYELEGYASVEQFVEFHVNAFIENQIEKQLAKDVNLKQKGHKIIFTGGGALRLKPYLEKRYHMNLGNIIVSDCAVYDNCASYLITYLLFKVREGYIEQQQGLHMYADLMSQIKSKYFEERRKLPTSTQYYQFEAH